MAVLPSINSVVDGRSIMDIWESVIEQIKTDLEACDETAIYEMLQSVPRENLRAYLPEGEVHTSTATWLDICNQEEKA
jgi:hypothetical protein|tara:strand:- start:74 stop:307 length:234 start_codon:yes stop_codon:yes gene_type:complete